MSFINPAPLSGYTTGDLISEDQINYWCGVLPDAIDGAQGGTYTLSNPLVINGDDLTIGEDLDVLGDTTLVAMTANTANILSDAAVAGALNANGPFVANSTATFNGNVVLGNTSSDTVTIAATPTLTTPLTLSGTGRVLESGSVITASASIDTASSRNIVLGTSAAGQTVTLTATGVVDGDWFILANVSGNSWTIAGIVSFTLANGDVEKFVHIGGTWRSIFRVA